MSFSSESEYNDIPQKNPLTQQASRANLEKEIAEIAGGTHLALNMRRNSISKRLQGQATSNYRQSSQVNLNLGGGHITQAYARAHMAVLGNLNRTPSLASLHSQPHVQSNHDLLQQGQSGGGDGQPVFSPTEGPRRGLGEGVKDLVEADIHPPWVREKTSPRDRKSQTLGVIGTFHTDAQQPPEVNHQGSMTRQTSLARNASVDPYNPNMTVNNTNNLANMNLNTTGNNTNNQRQGSLVRGRENQKANNETNQHMRESTRTSLNVPNSAHSTGLSFGEGQHSVDNDDDNGRGRKSIQAYPGDQHIVSPLALPSSSINSNNNNNHNNSVAGSEHSLTPMDGNTPTIGNNKPTLTPPSTPYLTANDSNNNNNNNGLADTTPNSSPNEASTNDILAIARARAMNQLENEQTGVSADVAQLNQDYQHSYGHNNNNNNRLNLDEPPIVTASPSNVAQSSVVQTEIKLEEAPALDHMLSTHPRGSGNQFLMPVNPQTAATSAEMLRLRRERQQQEEADAERDEKETMELYNELKMKATAIVEGSANRYNKLVTMAGRHAFCTADDLYNFIMTPHDALLMSHIAKPLLRIIDCRTKDSYLVEHIRGALYMTECTTQGARNALNTTPHFEQRAAALDPRNTIVFYGDEEVDDGRKKTENGENVKYSKLHAQLVQIMALVDDGISRLFTLRGGIEDFKAKFPFLICNIQHDISYDASDMTSIVTSVPHNHSNHGSQAGSTTQGGKRRTVRRRDVSERALKKQDVIDNAAVKIPSQNSDGMRAMSKKNRGYDRYGNGSMMMNGSGDHNSTYGAQANRHIVYHCPYLIPRSEMPELRTIREVEGREIDEAEFAGTLQNGHKIPGTSAFEFDPDLNVYPNLILEPWLFLGDQRCSWSLASLIDLQITHIINISTDICNYFEDHPAAKLPNGQFIKYLTIRMHDDRNSDIQSQFQMVFAFIDMAKQTDRNAKIMVHCQMGISRSASLIIAYIMHLTKCSLKDVYYYSKARRYIVQPNSGFWVQLSNVERQIRGGVTSVYDIMEAGLRKESNNGCGCCSIS